MAWKAAPTPAVVTSTGTTYGAGKWATGQVSPSPQNYPYTGQPVWVGAPHASELINLTTGQTV